MGKQREKGVSGGDYGQGMRTKEGVSGGDWSWGCERRGEGGSGGG